MAELDKFMALAEKLNIIEDNTNNDIIENIESLEARISDDKLIALGLFLELDFQSILDIKSEADSYFYNGESYIVYYDDEAQDAMEEELKYRLDQDVYQYINDYYHQFFDEYTYINNNLDLYGRDSLATYDGIENEFIYNNEYYYIYRCY